MLHLEFLKRQKRINTVLLKVDSINGQYRIDIIEKKPSEMKYEFYMYYYYIMNNIDSDTPKLKELRMAQEYSLNILMPKEDFLKAIDKFKNNNEIDMDMIAKYFNVDSDLAILWGKIIGILGFWS